MQFKDEVMQILKDHHDTLIVSHCQGACREETMYSNNRSLRLDFVMVIAAATSQASGSPGLVSAWAKSALYKRQCLAADLDAFPRASFANWSNEMSLASRIVKLDKEAEMRQWHSGQLQNVAILEQLFRGVTFGSHGGRVQILDMTVYDDQLMASVVHINTQASKSMPLLCYTGVAWGNAQAGQIRVTNVHAAAVDSLMAVARHDMPLLHMRGVKLPAKPLAFRRPQYGGRLCYDVPSGFRRAGYPAIPL